MSHSNPTIAALLFAFLSCADGVTAQCGATWLPGGALPGADAQVFAQTVWDPDGSGPLGPLVVMGGEFRVAGDQAATAVVAYDPATATWSTMGGMTNGVVHALTTTPNGDLVAGGAFTIGGVIANCARWDGATWQFLGLASGGGSIFALAVMPNGDLVAGGSFASMNGTPADNIARWDGFSWAPLGAGIATQGPTVRSLAVLNNGDLVAGGAFDTAGTTVAYNVARWDGATWSNIGPPTFFFLLQVEAMAVMPNGDLVVAGSIPWNGNDLLIPELAIWNGSTWSVLQLESHPAVGFYGLHVEPNGSLLVGGNFTSVGNGINAIYAPGVARLSGGTFSPLGTGIHGLVRSMSTLPNGDIVAAGGFDQAGGHGARDIARWDGNSWSPLTAGTTSAPFTMLQRPDRSIVAGGSFRCIEGVDANYVATWDGATWAPLGTGTPGRVTALAQLPNGDLVATGVTNVSRWNGSTWSYLGSATLGPVGALAARPNGDLLVGGAMLNSGGGFYGLLRWSGAAWQPVLGLATQSGTTFYQVLATTTLADGRVAVGGNFATAGGAPARGIAVWDGAGWSSLAGGMDGNVYTIVDLPNGDLVAAGLFSSAGGVAANNIARWNGTTWSPLGAGLDGLARGLVVLPNGDLVATGGFATAGGLTVNNIARWNGSAWTAFGTGLDGLGMALAFDVHDQLLVSGGFAFADGGISAYLARLGSSCPATNLPLGAGCASSGGSNTVTANLPWIGATWTAHGTGLPSQAFVLFVNGMASMSLPLPALLPQGVPGCTLFVQPDYVALALASAGEADLQFVVPNQPSLVGVVFHHQIVSCEFDASFAITSAVASNALSLTIGAF